MGTTLLHLLPEVVEDVTQGMKQKDIKTDYPIATLTVGLGFLLIVFIEMLAHTIQVSGLPLSCYYSIYGITPGSIIPYHLTIDNAIDNASSSLYNMDPQKHIFLTTGERQNIFDNYFCNTVICIGRFHKLFTQNGVTGPRPFSVNIFCGMNVDYFYIIAFLPSRQ